MSQFTLRPNDPITFKKFASWKPTFDRALEDATKICEDFLSSQTEGIEVVHYQESFAFLNNSCYYVIALVYKKPLSVDILLGGGEASGKGVG